MSDSEDKSATSEQGLQKQDDTAAEKQDASELAVKVENVKLEEAKVENQPTSN